MYVYSSQPSTAIYIQQMMMRSINTKFYCVLSIFRVLQDFKCWYGWYMRNTLECSDICDYFKRNSYNHAGLQRNQHYDRSIMSN